MTFYRYPDYMYHYGVKGMKWGVRKIKAGSNIGRVTANKQSRSKLTSKDRYFYTDKDRKLYEGDYAKRLNAPHAYSQNVRVKSDLYVASHKQAQNVLRRSMKDEKFRANAVDAVNLYRDKTPITRISKDYNRVFTKGAKDIAKGKASKEAYQAINYMMTNKSEQSRKLNRQYDKALIDAGYDALLDYNDMKLSGFNSKESLIVINRGKLLVDGYKKLY